MLYHIFDDRPPHAQWRSDGTVKSWINDGGESTIISARANQIVHTTDNQVIASYGPVVGPHPGPPFDQYGRITS